MKMNGTKYAFHLHFPLACLLSLWSITKGSYIPFAPHASRDADGCDPRVYRVLDDHRRSTKYLKSSFESALCDDLLPYGWYRFLSYGMPREMATECPAGNGCGTQAQVWLNVGTNILHTGNITVDACVSWGVEEESSASQGASLSDCCLFTLPVSIQNCNGFNVYYLGPTQACSIAYCSAAVPSKNHGVTSSTDMVGYPQKSLTPPKIVFYVKRDEFYFHCKSSCQECRFGWLIKRDLDSSMLKVGSNQRVQSAKDLGLKFGDELTCVTSPYLNRQSSTKSKPFKTGISLNRDHLELRNDGSTYNLVLDQHMPLMCGPMDSNQPCQIKASFSTGPNDEVPNSVVFGQCSQTLLDASVCTLIGQRNHCNRMTLPLQVGNPFQFWNRSKVEGNLSIHLEVTSLEEASIEQTLSLPYTIQILPRLLCHLFSFGNVVTFDQILFHLATQGKFVVLKSSSNDFEILARLTQVKSNMVALTSLEVRQFDERLTLNLTLDDMETVLAINRVNFQHFTIERLQYKNALLVTASSRRTIRINYEADFLSISILGLPEDVSLSDGLCVIERLADAEEYVISPTGMIQKYAHASQWNFHSCHQNSITKSTNELAMTFHRRMKLDQTTIPLEPKETLVQHIKDDEIPRLCTDKIVNSTLAKECGPFFRHDIMISINICIRDLSTFRRTSLATATIPLMESQCAASLQTSLERPIPEDLKEILECSNPCQHVDYCFIHNCNSTANGTKDSKVSSVLCDLRESRCLLPNNIVAWKPSVVNDVSLVLQASGGGNHSWVMPLAFDRGQLGFEIPTILSDTFQDSSSIYNTTMTWNQTDLAQITFYNSSCVICQASSCSKRDDVCELEGQCLPLFAISPLNACLVCSKDGQWILENSAKNLTSVHQEVFHIMAGDRWIYRVAANLSRLISAPMSMALSEQNILEWTAPPHGANSTQVVVLELISPCGVKYLDEFILKVTRCECRNGGWCVSHGDTIQCRCPKFWSGIRCETRREDCPSKCQFGQCIRNPESRDEVRCECHPGYTGKFCDVPIGSCSSSPCFKDVPCHEIPRGFLCDSCPPGFKGNGIRCTEVDPCSSNPCHPGVDCFLEEDDVGSFKCGPCPFRTRGNGTDCQAFSPCDSNPCHPDVECFPLGEDFICANCPPGFTGNGIHCTELLNGTNPCQVEATNPCFDPEMCQPNGSTVECLACPDGFKGDGIQCQPVTSNLCDSENPCHPSSSCLFVNGILTCGPCPDDMTGNGKVCHRIDRCSSNPCFEGVACSPNASWSGGFACGPCPAGMTGNGHDCNLILDFCDPNPCFRDVACVNHESGFQCARCPRGYHGNGLDCRPSLFNLCATSPCFEGVPCQTHGSTFKCGPCPPGSTGNGVECVPETPCSSNPCFPGVKCTDNLANHSFTCGSCPWGLYGNGSNCREPPHHCLSNPCYPGVQCFNFPDKFKCGNCPVGLTGNGVKCTSIMDPCNPSPCYDGVACVSIWEGKHPIFSCGLCPDGMVGNGIFCYDTDPCSPNPCHQGTQCQPDYDKETYECGSCPQGLVADGKVCREPFHPCESNPCFPGVDCGESNGTFSCGQCPDGMMGNGISCKGFSIVPCPETTHCFPGVAECLLTLGQDVICGSCPHGYIGDGQACEPVCDPRCKLGYKCSAPNTCTALCDPPCANGGECMSDGTCFCPTGITGDWCQFKTVPSIGRSRNPDQCHGANCIKRSMKNEDCLITGCEHGGTCLRKTGKCACKKGTFGSRCQQLGGPPLEMRKNKFHCKRRCQNGGQCVENNRCICSEGFRGRYCQKPKCRGGCRHGGQCVKPGVCQCKPGYSGPNCKQGLCSPHCLNGGFCRKSGKCKCPKGFRGKFCQLTSRSWK